MNDDDFFLCTVILFVFYSIINSTQKNTHMLVVANLFVVNICYFFYHQTYAFFCKCTQFSTQIINEIKIYDNNITVELFMNFRKALKK
jgi:hypothetical protein